MTKNINPFVSENYKTNFDSLRKAIEAGNVIKADKQYIKAVKELKDDIKTFTGKVGISVSSNWETLAKYAILTDLQNEVNKKPLRFIEKLKEIFKIGASAKKRIRNFTHTQRLTSFALYTKNDYLNVYNEYINNHKNRDGREENQEQEKTSYDSGYESSLNTEEEYGEPGYDDISDYKKKEGNNPDLQDKLSASELPKENVEKILTLTPSTVPKKASGAYISLDDVKWKNYPEDVENVQKANNIPLSSPVSGLSDKQVEEILTLTPPPVPKKIPGANEIDEYIYGHQNPEQLSIILEKKLFDMAARNNLSENNIKFLESRSAEDISELKNLEGKTALEVAEKAGNQQFMNIAYSKLEGIKGDDQEINRKSNEFFIKRSKNTKSPNVKERAKNFEKLGTNPADITQKAPPSTGVIVSKIVEQFEKPIDPTENKGR